MSDAMGRVSEEEIERLANRLAMLVSDDGEADNAGRAVGALARRLGLTGGQLKAIFMAGAESAAAQNVRVRRLEREVTRLREALEEAEARAQTARREADSLFRETRDLHAELAAQTGRQRTRLGALAVLVLLALGGGGWLAFGPKPHLGEQPLPANGAAAYRTAVVHDYAVKLRHDPADGAPALATLPPGTHLVVQRMLWHDLEQWVEVTYDGQTGYVLSTEVDLS